MKLESRIVNAMAAANCYFDELNSSKNSIFFDCYTIFRKKKTCFRLHFNSVEELTFWVENITITDIKIADKFKRILHPERFN